MQTNIASSAPGKSSTPVTLTSPPGPSGLPFVGSLVKVRRDVLGFFTDCAHRYGDVVEIRLGTWPTLLLSNPSDIEFVLVKEPGNFVKQRQFWRQVTAIFGQGLLTSEGAFWLRQRRLAAPAFTGQRLASYGAVMVRHTEQMLDRWQAGEVRDLHADMMALTLGIAAKTLFGSELKHDVAEIDNASITLLPT